MHLISLIRIKCGGEIEIIVRSGKGVIPERESSLHMTLRVYSDLDSDECLVCAPLCLI